MPELPEVETVVRMIRPGLEGRTIRSANVSWKRTVGGNERRFTKAVVGARIVRVWRRAKYIVADLERAGAPHGALVGHLRMTGRMHVERKGFDPGPHAKVALALDNGSTFHFIDVRKFGRLVWHADSDEELGDLGPEPLSDEFTAEWLADALAARRRILKPLLLDQTFVAGLGNIYVDESLHAAGLHPLSMANRAPREKVERLHAAIQRVLSNAIEREGSSFDTFYRTPEGNPGSYQAEFQVYGRDGQPCRACKTTIERLVVGQRGTHVCPRCQPKARKR